MASQASIVVPAHNEAGRIRGLLETLSDPSLAGRYDVYVICNGCVDDTRLVAGEYDVTVVDIEETGKHYALNEGDRLAGDVFPRLYCDADIRVSPATIQTLVETLTTDEVRAAGPEVRYGVETSSWPVKMYYRALESLIMTRWLDQHLVGRGLYGVSRAARRRFETFPGMVADDLFFDTQFSANEKVVPPGSPVILWVPASIRQVLRGETRVAQGNHEARMTTKGDGSASSGGLPRALATLRIRDRSATVRGWRRDLRRRDALPLLVYLSVTAGARALLIAKKLRGRQVDWR